MTQPLKPYPAYKDSGVPWLGKVPAHWEVRRLRTLANISTGTKDTINRKDNGQYPFFVRSQTIERIDSWTFDGEAVLTAGDGVGVAKVFHYINGKFDYHQRVYKFSNFNDTIGKFFFHYFKSMLRFEAFRETAKSTVDSLRLPMLQNFPVSLPPLPEQLAIVRYLDYMDQRIQRYIRAKQKLIKLLEEQKQAIIHQAVTRGLDPNVPLKPSGVGRFGNIPTNFKLTKLGRLCLSIRDGTHNPPPAVAGEHRLLSVRNIINSKFVIRDDDRTMSPNAFAELQRSYTVQVGDIAIALVGATTGKSAVVEPMDKVTVQRSIGILRPDPKILDSHFLNYVISSQLVQAQIQEVMSKYAAQPGIYLNEVSELQILYPSLDMQKEITKVVLEQINYIERNIKGNQQKLGLITEYRTRLIADVVTGKVDVRAAVAGLGDEPDAINAVDSITDEVADD